MDKNNFLIGLPSDFTNENYKTKNWDNGVVIYCSQCDSVNCILEYEEFSERPIIISKCCNDISFISNMLDFPMRCDLKQVFDTPVNIKELSKDHDSLQTELVDYTGDFATTNFFQLELEKIQTVVLFDVKNKKLVKRLDPAMIDETDYKEYEMICDRYQTDNDLYLKNDCYSVNSPQNYNFGIKVVLNTKNCGFIFSGEKSIFCVLTEMMRRCYY